jgi:hypothetical protein
VEHNITGDEQQYTLGRIVGITLSEKVYDKYSNVATDETSLMFSVQIAPKFPVDRSRITVLSDVYEKNRFRCISRYNRLGGLGHKMTDYDTGLCVLVDFRSISGSYKSDVVEAWSNVFSSHSDEIDIIRSTHKKLGTMIKCYKASPKTIAIHYSLVRKCLCAVSTVSVAKPDISDVDYNDRYEYLKACYPEGFIVPAPGDLCASSEDTVEVVA